MSKNLDRWGEILTDPTKRALSPGRASIITQPWDPDALYSYGRHFPLAYVLRAAPDKPAHLVLLNGDRYSVTTAQHQAEVREVVRLSGVPSLIVPFSALRSAGIDLDSVRLLESLPDRWIDLPRRRVPVDRLPWNAKDREVHGDGTATYTPRRHLLGESVFSAVARGRRRRYLSGFDRNESRPLYFLAELPRCTASTVDEALEALKPDAVKLAEGLGRECARQGDIFAIPMPEHTRADLRRSGAVFGKRVSLLGTAHVATEVATMPDGVQYARGCMYHDPRAVGQWRERDHARCKLGDGKTWHIVARNTVPTR